MYLLREITTSGGIKKEGRKFISYMGGYNFGCKDDEILETVEAEDFESLDWSKTTLLIPDSDAGWLDRNGKFYGCRSEDHDVLAYFYLKKDVSELEKEGWVRVYGGPDTRASWVQSGWVQGGRFDMKLSADQRNWLSLQGHEIGEWD